MNEPLVSVGIPCYNRPEGLRRTLECITNQTYKNLEIVISDNGSPDPGVQWVGYEYAYKDPRVKYYQQHHNMGGEFNFSFVLKNSHGKYFMWASDDDEWHPDYIKNLLPQIKDNVLLSSGMVTLVGNNGVEVLPKQIPKWFNSSRFAAMFFILTSHQWAYSKANMVYGIFKKDFLLSGIPILNECSPEVGSDILFLIRILSKGEIKYTAPFPLMTKHMNHPLYKKPEGHMHALGPIRYILNRLNIIKNSQHEGIDQFTYVVSKIIEESGFGMKQKIILKIANQINRIRMMLLY